MNNRVEKFIAELVSLAKDISPEAEIEISSVSIEGEDATIQVVTPDGKADEVHEALLHRRYDIFMDEGYDIIVMVYDREELAARMGFSARAA
ncbi:hypothetical protein FJZ31_10320 [Candidatus Poribacteria bacterium]|nr:hypothetical protein [Candidatus Poribacteria bacterium]